MKIYLAARYGRKHEMQEYASYLETIGHIITSRWLVSHEAEETKANYNAYYEVLETYALEDLEDVDRAEAVVSFTHKRGTPVSGGGRHVEFGYGYARGKRMIIIGEKEHIFHHLPMVEIYPSFDDWKEMEIK